MSRNGVRRKIAVMIKLLMSGSHSIMELTTKAGMDKETVRAFVKDLHDAELVHISCYRENASGPQVARYTFGPGIDAERPPTKKQLREEARRRREILGWVPPKSGPIGVSAPSSVFDLGRHVLRSGEGRAS